MEAYAIPNQEATTVAHCLVDDFFLHLSVYTLIRAGITNLQWLRKLLGVKKSRTTPYHPQSDGLVERFNRTLLDMLATAVRERPFQWEDHLRRLCFAYNTSVHPTTGFSPFTLMFGRQARLPMDIVLGTIPPEATTVPEYVAHLHDSLKKSYEHVRNQMGHHQQQQKTHHDALVQGKSFEVGDLVWLHNPAVPRGKSRKLH